jgi:hypothetical protein
MKRVIDLIICNKGDPTRGVDITLPANYRKVDHE